MDVILNLLGGFFTWHTPLSFLAGVGAHHLYCKYIREREGPMLEKKADGTYGYTVRFWVVASVAAVLIGFIGWRTQDTADRVEDQAIATRDCVTEVITALNVARSVSVENDDLSQKERDAFREVLISISNPPPELASLPYNNPVRQDHIQRVVAEQVKVLVEIGQQKRANAEYRAEHPFRHLIAR